MNTISIFSLSSESGGALFQAVSGEQSSLGSTAGEALDGIHPQLTEKQSSTLVLLQEMKPDLFFSEEQRKRLEALMSRWRSARDRGEVLIDQEMEELNKLAQQELQASRQRAEALAEQLDS